MKGERGKGQQVARPPQSGSAFCCLSLPSAPTSRAPQAGLAKGAPGVEGRPGPGPGQLALEGWWRACGSPHRPGSPSWTIPRPQITRKWSISTFVSLMGYSRMGTQGVHKIQSAWLTQHQDLSACSETGVGGRCGGGPRGALQSPADTPPPPATGLMGLSSKVLWTVRGSDSSSSVGQSCGSPEGALLPVENGGLSAHSTLQGLVSSLQKPSAQQGTCPDPGRENGL